MSRSADHKVRDTLIGAVVVLAVLSPDLFTHKGFGLDTSNHGWLAWVQGTALAHTGHPTLFLSTDGMGVLQPFYGFYGGTLYTFAGVFNVLLGNQHPLFVYIALSGMFVAMAYRGVWLIAQQAGVSRMASHLPAFIFVTSAYYVTDLYLRGAWTEFAALSSLPFALGYGVRLLREEWTARTVAAFAFGTVLLTGSHNISLLFTTLIVAVVAPIVYFAAGDSRPPLARVVRLAGLTALSISVNAWFLGLDVLHSKSTAIAQGGLYDTMDFSLLKNTLDPLRGVPASSTTYGLAVAAPILAVLMAIALRTLSLQGTPRSPAAYRRIWWVLILSVAALLGVITAPMEWWAKVGHPFTLIQFPYRLMGWVTLGCALVLVFSLRLARDSVPSTRRWLVTRSAVLIAITLFQAGAQVYRTDPNKGFSVRDRNQDFLNPITMVPPTWYDGGGYRDASLPVVTITDPNRLITLPVPKPGVSTIRASFTLPAGDGPILTNIAGGPYVVKVFGPDIRVVGRSDAGFIVVAPKVNNPLPKASVIVAEGHGGFAQTFFSWVSILSLFGLVGLVIRLRRRGRADSADDTAAVDTDPEPLRDDPSSVASETRVTEPV